MALANASVQYGSSKVVRDLTICVHAGEVVGLIGPSGSGKTSVLRALSGFVGLADGVVKIDGTRLEFNSPIWPQVRKRVGYVQQGLHLWPYRTVLEHLTEGPVFALGLDRDQAEERATHWAGRLQISDHLNKYPLSLSGGEQQRVAIARAMAMEPEGLMLDEITSSLDPILAGEIGELVASLRTDGVGVIVVSHQIDWIRRHADWTYFLYEGHLHEFGRAAEVLSHPRTPELATFIERVRKGW